MGWLFSAGLSVHVLRRREPHSMMGRLILNDSRGPLGPNSGGEETAGQNVGLFFSAGLPVVCAALTGTTQYDGPLDSERQFGST